MALGPSAMRAHRCLGPAARDFDRELVDAGSGVRDEKPGGDLSVSRSRQTGTLSSLCRRQRSQPGPLERALRGKQENWRVLANGRARSGGCGGNNSSIPSVRTGGSEAEHTVAHCAHDENAVEAVSSHLV